MPHLLQCHSESQGRSALTVRANDLYQARKVPLGMTHGCEHGFYPLETEGDVTAPVQLGTDLGERGHGRNGRLLDVFVETAGEISRPRRSISPRRISSESRISTTTSPAGNEARLAPFPPSAGLTPARAAKTPSSMRFGISPSSSPSTFDPALNERTADTALLVRSSRRSASSSSSAGSGSG